MEYAEDGDLHRYDAAEIAAAGLWDGAPMTFINSLCESHFLDGSIEDKNIAIHDWMDYAGRLVEIRRRKAEGMKRQRAATLPARDATVTARAVTNRTQPYPTQPNQTVPNLLKQNFPEWFKTLSQDPRWHGKDPERYIKSIEKTYSGLNLDLEAHSAYEWLQSPKGQKKKVLRGFWTNWLKNTLARKETSPNGKPGGHPQTNENEHETTMQREARLQRERFADPNYLPKVRRVKIDAAPE